MAGERNRKTLIALGLVDLVLGGRVFVSGPTDMVTIDDGDRRTESRP
jgi:hypothetical protein